MNSTCWLRIWEDCLEIRAKRPTGADYRRRWERAVWTHWKVERDDEERGRVDRMAWRRGWRWISLCCCLPVEGVLVVQNDNPACSDRRPTQTVKSPLVQMAEPVSCETLNHYFKADKLRAVRRRRAWSHTEVHLHQLLYCVSLWPVTITTYLLARRRKMSLSRAWLRVFFTDV